MSFTLRVEGTLDKKTGPVHLFVTSLLFNSDFASRLHMVNIFYMIVPFDHDLTE